MEDVQKYTKTHVFVAVFVPKNIGDTQTQRGFGIHKLGERGKEYKGKRGKGEKIKIDAVYTTLFCYVFLIQM